ncbi:MAG: TIGR03668 family PPOX class F420-dependent oxidoreductase [Alphaproteobacteria bacterium]
MKLNKKDQTFIRCARVAHLATADAAGQPHVIPICFVFDGNEFFSPIDEKPKKTSAQNLKRVRNVKQNEKISLIIDRYEENWSKLAYLLITGTAKIILRGKRHQHAVALLRKKYSQYRRMSLDERPMIQIKPSAVTRWGAV